MDILELSKRTDVSRRTIRYYIQEGLLPPPKGETRAALYSEEHLEILLRIRRLQSEGLSLEAIRRRLENKEMANTPIKTAGTVEVWRKIYIQEGVELFIDPSTAELSSSQVSALTHQLTEWLQQNKDQKENE